MAIVQVRGAGRDVELFVRSSGQLAPDQSMWVPLVLPVAMRHGLDLHIHGTVDETGLVGGDRAQTLLASWWPKLRRVQVTADRTSTGSPGDGVGLAFSAGVDAFHSLRSHLDEVTHLWFVHGFDVPLWRTRLREQISGHLGKVADATGKQLVEVATNAKPWADQHVRWGEIYHGAATAGIAIGHGPLWGRALIASGRPANDAQPWGSHPELDPCWSSSNVRVLHDDPGLDRVEKVRQIAEWGVAMDNLRVCWLTPDQEYNCGTCDKCVRTKVNLIAVGGSSRMLPTDVSPSMVRPAGPGDAAYHARTNLRHLRSEGIRPDLVEALGEALRRGPAHARAQRARQAARQARRALRLGRRR